MLCHQPWFCALPSALSWCSGMHLSLDCMVIPLAPSPGRGRTHGPCRYCFQVASVCTGENHKCFGQLLTLAKRCITDDAVDVRGTRILHSYVLCLPPLLLLLLLLLFSLPIILPSYVVVNFLCCRADPTPLAFSFPTCGDNLCPCIPFGLETARRPQCRRDHRRRAAAV